MIAKQVKGSNFFRLLKYVHEKDDSHLIGSNMAGKNPIALASEFRLSQRLNYRVNKAVYHCSLSIPPTEKLSDGQWLKIAQEYLQGMKFDKSQYVVYRHQDRDHEHIHIIASRIGLDGKTVPDSYDYPRSEKVLRELITQYGLSQVAFSKNQLRKAPTTGEMRRCKRTGEKPIRTRLQDTIDSLTQDLTTIDDLVAKLASKGIETRINKTKEGKIRGISYKLDGIAFSGSKLGSAYTFSGLQKYKNVVYQPEQFDTEQLELSSETVKIEADILNQPLATSTLPLEVEIVMEGEKKGLSVKPSTPVAGEKKGLSVKPSTPVAGEKKGLSVKPSTPVEGDLKGLSVKPSTPVEGEDLKLSLKPSTPVAQINSTRKLKPEKNKAKIKSANHHQPQLKVELVMEMNTDIEQTAPVSEINLNQQPQHPINIVFEVSPTNNQAPHQSMNKKINNSRKEFYRQKYLLFKRLIEQKLQIQDQKLIDKTIAELVFRQTGATDEVRATLSQSDLLISLLDNLSEEQYREIVWEYVDKLAREVEREVEYER